MFSKSIEIKPMKESEKFPHWLFTFPANLNKQQLIAWFKPEDIELVFVPQTQVNLPQVTTHLFFGSTAPRGKNAFPELQGMTLPAQLTVVVISTRLTKPSQKPKLMQKIPGLITESKLKGLPQHFTKQ